MAGTGGIEKGRVAHSSKIASEVCPHNHRKRAARMGVPTRSLGGRRIRIRNVGKASTKACDSEGIADAARAADQAQHAAFAGELIEIRTSVEMPELSIWGCHSG